jgi:hypothetical protein
MNVEQILSEVRQKGVILIPDGDRIKYKAPSGIMTSELIEAIKKHKQAILSILTPNRETMDALGQSDNLKPGDCDHCPAAGYWDWKGPGLWCFHRAFFLGKSGHPKACDTAKHDCPLKRVK